MLPVVNNSENIAVDSSQAVDPGYGGSRHSQQHTAGPSPFAFNDDEVVAPAGSGACDWLPRVGFNDIGHRQGWLQLLPWPLPHGSRAVSWLWVA